MLLYFEPRGGPFYNDKYSPKNVTRNTRVLLKGKTFNLFSVPVKVRYELPNGIKRCFPVNSVLDVPRRVTFTDDTNRTVTVEQYFEVSHLRH